MRPCTHMSYRYNPAGSHTAPRYALRTNPASHKSRKYRPPNKYQLRSVNRVPRCRVVVHSHSLQVFCGPNRAQRTHLRAQILCSKITILRLIMGAPRRSVNTTVRCGNARGRTPTTWSLIYQMIARGGLSDKRCGDCLSEILGDVRGREDNNA